MINMFTEKALFHKFWNYQFLSTKYKLSKLPGFKKGISASTVGGRNIGISKYISDERKKAAVEAIRYLTSYEVQKEYIIKSKRLPAIDKLYEDENVCQVIDCELGKSIQLLARPGTLTADYDEYSFQFSSYIKEFLFGDKEASDILSKVNDITKINYISLNNSKAAFIIFIIAIVITIVMISSFTFLFIEKFKKYFKFLSTKSWSVIFIGFIMRLIVIPITQYGKLEDYKCQLNFILISLSVNFIFIPILQRLIVNFPERIKIINWLEKTKYREIIYIFLFDLLLNCLLFIRSFETREIKISNGKNYKTCTINDLFGKIILIVILLDKVLLIISLLLVLFSEWNKVDTIKDIRIITTSLYMEFLIIIIVIIKSLIKINNYEYYFIFYSIITIIYAFSCYFIIYGINIFNILSKKKEVLNLNEINISTTTSNTKSEYSSKNNIFISKIMKYHYYTGEEV